MFQVNSAPITKSEIGVWMNEHTVFMFFVIALGIKMVHCQYFSAILSLRVHVVF